MRTNAPNTIREKYSELISYITAIELKHEITMENQVEITIKISDYFEREVFKIHLFQPFDREYEYNFHRLRVSWCIPPDEHLNHNHWFNEDLDQKEIFNIILFDMIKYKINNIDQETIDTSNTFIYMILKDWIKNKEIGIQKTKPAKYHKHLFFRISKIKLYRFLRKIHFK